MKSWKNGWLVGVLAVPSFAQQVDVQVDVDLALAKAREKIALLQSEAGPMELEALQSVQAQLAQIDAGGFKEQTLMAQEAIEKVKTQLAQAFPQPSPKPVDDARIKAETMRGMRDAMRDVGSGAYEAGTRALDNHRYEDAIRGFDAVINTRGARADGALYWKAYALDKAGRRDEALATIVKLRADYPASRWLNDAQALEAAVKQGSGQPASATAETNEDLKLMAINSLMNADPDRAVPLLEGLLKGNSAPKVKERALFVLTQSKTPRASTLLSEYAKGAGNPDLQARAIRYLGMSGTPDSLQQLSSIYGSTSDATVKREIIRALMMSKGTDQVFNLAKSEKDPELRLEAIRQLGSMRATTQLTQLFATETSADNKVSIVRSLMVAGAGDKLLDLAKNEKDPKVRAEAIRSLAMNASTPVESILQFYASETDTKARRDLISGLAQRGDVKTLVDLARKEQDPAMKKFIVERLSTSRSKEATEYMMELLK
ncbi:MAG TPA: HEAT repeat domain-containing protein [Bryobacteraceae bacterium]|nr:HEAT repeat domain-containing protein [Bryobacteraceae bacterium]